MASVVPTNAMVQCMAGDLDLNAASALKCTLLKSSYTPNPDHKFMADVSASECDATGFAGGFGGADHKTLTSVTITEDTVNNRAVVDAANPATFSAIGGASNNDLNVLAVYAPGTSYADSQIVALLEFASVFSTNGGDLLVQFDAAGLFYTQH